VRLVWEASERDARFDLTLQRRELDGSLVLVEQWEGLAGRVSAPWEPLAAGTWYRWTIAPTGAGERGQGAAETWFLLLAPEQVARALDRVAAIDVLTAEVVAEEPVLDVLRCRVLETHGLLTDAEALWSDLAERRPERDDLGRQVRRLRARQLRPETASPALNLPFAALWSGG
jgi:hypothetical protein